MTAGATLVASLLLTLSRPATWPLALAAFLLRGGFVAVLVPMVVLPTAVGLANVVVPALTTFIFRGLTPSIAVPLAVIAGGALLWLVAGGFVAAAAEADLVRRIASDEEVRPARPSADVAIIVEPSLWRLVTVRLLAHLPLVLAASWGAVRLISVAYRELSVPGDVTVPLALRVASAAPDAVAVVGATWLLGETVGALAARRLVMIGGRVPPALGWALLHVIRRPIRTAVLAVVLLAPMVSILVAVGLAVSTVWDALSAQLSLGTGILATLVLVTILVALFGAGLVLIGVTSAWRGAVWTLEVAGTFGATVHGPEGPWTVGTDSATLGDLRPRGVDPDPR